MSSVYNRAMDKVSLENSSYLSSLLLLLLAKVGCIFRTFSLTAGHKDNDWQHVALGGRLKAGNATNERRKRNYQCGQHCDNVSWCVCMCVCACGCACAGVCFMWVLQMGQATGYRTQAHAGLSPKRSLSHVSLSLSLFVHVCVCVCVADGSHGIVIDRRPVGSCTIYPAA